jgi:hypothetical protein
VKEKLIRIYYVIADTDQQGPAGDGTVIFRFRRKADASAFAGKNTHYGHPCTVKPDDVPRRLAERWGCA